MHRAKPSSSSLVVATSDGARSVTPTESRFRGVAVEERERSFSKTKHWLDENWPSSREKAAGSADEEGAGERKRAKEERAVRRMRSDYSNQCHELSSKYRDLKSRADEVISALTSASSEDTKSGRSRASGRDVAATGSRTAALQFGTPKRSNRSRLSGDMTSSLSLAQRQAEEGGNGSVSDTGKKSLGGESAASSDSHHVPEFLKYHRSHAGASDRGSRVGAAAVESSSTLSNSSHLRGPDFWKQQVAQNYNDLSREPAAELRAPVVNRETEGGDVLSESRMREQVLLESDARIAADRHLGM